MKERFKNYFMKIALETAQLSYAKRKKVGAIIVKDDRIISIGYNGTPAGWDNECETLSKKDVQPWMHPSDYVIYNVLKTKPEVLHAETNAIAKVAQSSDSSHGASLFCTHTPCIECAKLIYQSGIKTVYYHEDYEPAKGSGVSFLKTCGIELEQIALEN